MNIDKLDKKSKERIQEFCNKAIINNDDCIGFIGITNTGFGVEGETSVILTLVTLLIKRLVLEEKVCTKEQIEQCVRLAFMSGEELEREVLEKFKQKLEELEKMINE